MKNILDFVYKDKTLLGKIVVFKDDKIYKVFDSYKEAFKIALDRKDLTMFMYPKNILETRILPLRIKSFKKHPWTPVYSIDFLVDDKVITQKALIDSGAHISAINYDFGLELGFTKQKHDYIFEVVGLGGHVDYVLKSIYIVINDIKLQIPAAWLQDKNSTDIIIGREIVFDRFDIEFRQNSEEIVFKEIKTYL